MLHVHLMWLHYMPIRLAWEAELLDASPASIRQLELRMKRWMWVLLAALAIVSAGFIAMVGTERGQDLVLARIAVATMSSDDEAAPYDGIRVFMCGTSSPLPAPDRAQACVAIAIGDRLYLVDAGAGSARVASLAGLPLQNLRAVLLTHFHSDHIAAVPDFNLNSWVAGRAEPLAVIGPEGVNDVVEGLNQAYALDRDYRVAHHGADLLPPELGIMQPIAIEPGVILDEFGLIVRAFLVDHAPIAPAVGYRFDYLGRSVVVSGDTIATASLEEASANADLLLHDAISVPIISTLAAAAATAGRDRPAKILHDILDYHASTTDLVGLAERAGVRQLALYHLIPPPQNMLMERMFRRGLPSSVLLTEDAMVFELPANSTAIDVR